MEWREELERRREAEREGSREGMRVRGDSPEARSAGNREEGEERSKQVRGRERCLGTKTSADPKSASRSREIGGARPGKHGQADSSEHRQSREGERERREAEESKPVHN